MGLENYLLNVLCYCNYCYEHIRVYRFNSIQLLSLSIIITFLNAFLRDLLTLLIFC